MSSGGRPTSCGCVARDEAATREFTLRLRAWRRIPARRARGGDRARRDEQRRRPMPYACGLHPGFNWPFAGASREGARVVFAERRSPRSRSSRPAVCSRRRCGRFPCKTAQIGAGRRAVRTRGAVLPRCGEPVAALRTGGRVGAGADGRGFSAYRLCGAGRARRFSASKFGRVTAIPSASPAICSRNRQCASWRPAAARGTRRRTVSFRLASVVHDSLDPKSTALVMIDSADLELSA